MTWTYNQSDGTLTHNGVFEGTGYSGTGIGRNTPLADNIPNVGPIPAGTYNIGEAHADGALGPCVMNLTPDASTNTFGRTLFRIHGDNARHDASHGCIILGPAIRREIAASDDRVLVVVA